MSREWTQKTYNGESTIKYPYINKGQPHRPLFYVGLKIVSKEGKILHQVNEIGPFDRLKDGEIAISEKFLNEIQ